MARRSAALISVFSALGAFLFGLDIGYIASILECPAFKRDVGRLTDWKDPNSEISSTISGFIVASFSIGCICASFPLCSAYFLDSWGRKGSISLGSTVFVVGAVIQSAASSVIQMAVGRLIAGFSIGLLSTVVVLYQSELAPASMRGSLTSIYQLMIVFGIFVATWLDWVLVGNENGWRIAIVLQIFPAAALLLGMTYLPRSPRWLVQQGYIDEAREVLNSLRAEQEDANTELEEIVNTVESSKIDGEPLWTELFQGRVGKLTLLGITLQLLQQFVGMNAFMYFGPRIFKTAGINAFAFQAFNGGVCFLSTFPALILADHCGRRALLISGAVGMTIASLAMGAVGSLTMKRTTSGDWSPDGTVSSNLVILCSLTFVINFCYSWGPVVWMYNAEIFPLKYRSRCVGAATTANWIGNYVIAQFTPMLLESIGFSTFYIFAVFSFLGLLLALWIPETKGVLLEHIDQLFDEKFGLDSATLGTSTETSLMPSKSSTPGMPPVYGATAERA